MTDKYYIKKSNKYIEYAEKWQGFPSCSGIYLVLNAKKNSLIKLSETPTINDFPEITTTSEELFENIMVMLNINNQRYSFLDLIKWSLSFLADHYQNSHFTTLDIDYSSPKEVITDFFDKEGRFYKPLKIYDFVGWPVDGVWLSQNGHNTCLLPFKEGKNKVNTNFIKFISFQHLILETLSEENFFKSVCKLENEDFFKSFSVRLIEFFNKV